MVLMNFPLLVFALSFVVLLLAALFGDTIRTKVHALKGEEHDDFDVVLSATLTLLGLLIGFSFSMAISRYDQRKNYEEAEANESAQSMCERISFRRTMLRRCMIF